MYCLQRGCFEWHILLTEFWTEKVFFMGGVTKYFQRKMQAWCIDHSPFKEKLTRRCIKITLISWRRNTLKIHVLSYTLTILKGKMIQWWRTTTTNTYLQREKLTFQNELESYFLFWSSLAIQHITWCWYIEFVISCYPREFA